MRHWCKKIFQKLLVYCWLAMILHKETDYYLQIVPSAVQFLPVAHCSPVKDQVDVVTAACSTNKYICELTTWALHTKSNISTAKLVKLTFSAYAFSLSSWQEVKFTMTFECFIEKTNFFLATSFLAFCCCNDALSYIVRTDWLHSSVKLEGRNQAGVATKILKTENYMDNMLPPSEWKSKKQNRSLAVLKIYHYNKWRLSEFQHIQLQRREGEVTESLLSVRINFIYLI